MVSKKFAFMFRWKYPFGLCQQSYINKDNFTNQMITIS